MTGNGGLATELHISLSTCSSLETLIDAITLCAPRVDTFYVEGSMVLHIHLEVIEVGCAKFSIAVLHHVKLSVLECAVVDYRQLTIVVEGGIPCTKLHRACRVVTIVDPIDFFLSDRGLACDVYSTAVEEITSTVQCHSGSCQFGIVAKVHKIRSIGITRRICQRTCHIELTLIINCAEVANVIL